MDLRWKLLAAGAIVASLAMLLLILKWKLPLARSAAGGAVAVLVALLPFVWLYPRSDTVGCQVLTLIGQVALTLALAFGLMLLAFSRDPERTPPERDGVILSPADGRVVYVRSLERGEVPLVAKGGREYRLTELTGVGALEGPYAVIGVEMNFLDVHVNRCPIAGRVKASVHIPGAFVSLRRAEAPFLNERWTTVIEGRALTVIAVQVASRLVRRIQTFVVPGQEVDAGQRLGVIRFGSLVAVVLPQRPDVRTVVVPGQRVLAGISVLARFQDARVRSGT